MKIESGMQFPKNWECRSNLTLPSRRLGITEGIKGASKNLQDRFYALLYGKNLEPVLLFDKRVAFNFITSLAGYIDEPLEQPSITLQGSEVIITPGKAGVPSTD